MTGECSYVWIGEDGSARELHANERRYLEFPFHPTDGFRPYVKSSYLHKNGWGKIEGFLMRSELPVGVDVKPAPLEDPRPDTTRELEKYELIRKKGDG